ncbi:glucose dehydrogenase [FAD, quinone]-like [Mytilus trossulus]|uniref:glucose dehydrogenase [FAD, quinone]-like n=1 Tax=Mytilus trossulus TaxID=6551 RepID=UPI0030072F85
MFLGESLLKISSIASLTNFLSLVLQPRPVDPPGIFETPISNTYDYIVVGAGSAGSIVATRLSEDCANVLLLEAGGTDLDDERTQIPLMWFFLQGTAMDWGYWTVPQKFSHRAMKNERSYWARGKMIGGSSAMNAMGFVRGSRFDFEQWEREGATGWGYDKVLPYFKKLENAKLTDYGNCGNFILYLETRGKFGPIVVNQESATPLSFFHLKAAAEMNLPVIDCSDQNPRGICVTQSNIKNGTRCNSGNCYLRPALERQNLQILFRKNKAVGVEFVKDNKTIRVFAKKEVILSAGVIGSAQILLLSGIGPTEHLRQMNINVKSNLPVGKNMQDHLDFFLKYNINMSLNTNSENFATPRRILNFVFNKKGIFTGSGGDVNVFTHTCRKMNEGPNIQLTIIPTAYEKDAVEDLFLNLKNEVVKEHLKRVNSNSFQVILYILKPKSIRFTRRLEKTSAWKSINATYIRHDTPNHCSEIEYDSDDYWECMLRHFTRRGDHQMGTCRMGSVNDPSSVVDPRLRLVHYLEQIQE